jgi:hypothetical protein
VIDRRLVLVVLFCLSCKPAASVKSNAPATPAGPQMRATVVTIETKLGARTLRNTITIANGRARSSDELDRWRLFDLKSNRVTFVDDVDKTYRTVDAAQLIAQRRSGLDDDDVPEGLPRAVVTRGPAPDELTIRLGAYERHLRVAQHKDIPPNLFAMMHASDPVATPLAPVMRAAEDALLAVQGFPVEDHAELPYGDKRMVVHRAVVSIAQANVPGTLLDVNRAYRELPALPVAKPRPRVTKPKAVVQETTPVTETVAPPVTDTTATTATDTSATVEPPKPKPVAAKKAPATKKVVKKAPAKKPVVKKKATPKKAPVKKKVTPKKH